MSVHTTHFPIVSHQLEALMEENRRLKEENARLHLEVQTLGRLISEREAEEEHGG